MQIIGPFAVAILLLVISGCGASPPSGAASTTLAAAFPPQSYSDLVQTLPATNAHAPIAALKTGTGNWFDSQSFDPCVVKDPRDSSTLIMLFSGMAAPLGWGEIQIGRATASTSDPTTWTVSNSGNPVLSPGSPGSWDETNIRQDSCFFVGTTLHLYYTGSNSGDTVGGIGLATSTDFGLTWTKQGEVLTPTGQGRDDGDHVSQGAVLREEPSTWTMIYAYRNGSTVLPGYRYATSLNGVNWTKGGSGDVLSCAVSHFCEFHQLLKLGTDYLLFYETGSTNVAWQINLAHAASVTGPYVDSPSNPVLTQSGTAGAFDRYHVATPFWLNLNNTAWLFYIGGGDLDQPYGFQHYELAVTQITEKK